MPLYNIERAERGVRYRTYRIVADDPDEALDLMHDAEPDTERFKQHDADTEIEELPDCRCGICRLEYPWACLDSAPEDDVLMLGDLERVWDV